MSVRFCLGPVAGTVMLAISVLCGRGTSTFVVGPSAYFTMNAYYWTDSCLSIYSREVTILPVKLSEARSQPCSIARALSVIGDGWMLLLLRDAFRGVRRFSDFEVGTGAQPTVVSDRLKRMVDIGLLERVEYQRYPSRHEYRLTEMGNDLYPALIMLSRWGDTYLDDGKGSPADYVHTACGHSIVPQLTCSHCGDEIDVNSLTVVPKSRAAARVSS